MLKYERELIAYSEAFVSFVISKIEDVNKIILFGSVARGEADKESDIDIFFDIDKGKENKIKETLNNELGKFYKSNIAEVWKLKGISNEIKNYVGKLEEWKLKRSIISEGIVLYGKYEENPKNLKSFVYFNLLPIKNIAKRNSIIRKLFGRIEKKYTSRGLVEELGGTKLSASSFIIPLSHGSRIRNLLNKEKVYHKSFEIWIDKTL